MALLQQLLYSESLSLSWRDIIVPVVRQIVQTVRPDVRSCDDDMDIRQLVHIKKVVFLYALYFYKCDYDRRANLYIWITLLREKKTFGFVLFWGVFVDPWRKEV